MDYNLQPRHFIPGAIGTPPTNANATSPEPANRSAINGNAAPFVPQNGYSSTSSNGYAQPRGYSHQGNQSQSGAGPGAGTGTAVGSPPSAADNKAAQDIAAQIALSNALHGLNNPLQAQSQQGQGSGQIGQPPPLNQAALAAAAAYNPNLIPGLYGNPLYGVNGVGGVNPGAVPFYPGQADMAAATAVANAVASLPLGAFQAALQNVGLGTYPLNHGIGVPGLPGVGLGVGVPGVGMPGGGIPMAALGMGMPGQSGLPGQQGPSANNRKTSLYKTELCRSWEEKGTCRYGPKCQFAHGEEELKRVQRHPKVCSFS